MGVNDHRNYTDFFVFSSCGEQTKAGTGTYTALLPLRMYRSNPCARTRTSNLEDRYIMYTTVTLRIEKETENPFFQIPLFYT